MTTIEEFVKLIPNETAAVKYWRDKREKEGIMCKECGENRHYWLKAKKQWQCAKCRFRTGIRSGSVMQDSNLPVRVWLKCMFLMCNTKKGISACEMQRQLGIKCYRTVWYMMHKIRGSMGFRDDCYKLKGSMELDDAMITVLDKDGVPKPETLSRGRGSERKRPILVAVEIRKTSNPRSKRPSTIPVRIKLRTMPDMKGQSVLTMVSEAVQKNTHMKTDGHRSFKRLNKVVNRHQQQTVPSKEAHVILPWVHTMIGNLKRVLNGVYHRISDKFLQLYLDEFAYKTNRRFAGIDLFERVAIAGIQHRW